MPKYVNKFVWRWGPIVLRSSLFRTYYTGTYLNIFMGYGFVQTKKINLLEFSSWNFTESRLIANEVANSDVPET